MEIRVKVLAFLSFLILISFSWMCNLGGPYYDIVIKNGTIIDGSGNPRFISDIGIKEKRVAKIGKIDAGKAGLVIDAQNLIVTPGFIDVHTHCDRGIAHVPTVDNYILQGVTTVIGGNCGGHPFPLKELFQVLEDIGISPNFGSLIGHNTIRREVMKYKMEAPTPDEMEKMKELITEEMRAGGLGFSTGLSYLPGIYADTQEIIDLAAAVAPFQGIYASHIRDQGEHITEAIEEAIKIGEENGLTVQISHIKLAEDRVWGELDRIVKPVEEAQKRGVDVYLDQYPYTATSSGFTSSFPSWAFEGGRERFFERLKDKNKLQEIKEFIIHRRLSSEKGIDKLDTIYIANYSKQPEFNGKNLKEILLSRGVEPTVENGVMLIIEIEKNGGASGVFFQMDEKDVEKLMQLPYTLHASDGGVQIPGEGVPHPRNYGTFPKVIAHYVRDRNVITLEESIKKMTSLPAQVFRLKERGILKEGMYADVTIFDFDTFTDKATFSQPHQYSRGLAWVIVNGSIVVENNQHTGKLTGMVLYGPGTDFRDSQ